MSDEKDNLVDVSKVDAKTAEKEFGLSKPQGQGGLKSFRRQTAKKPSFNCGNCKCVRYSPCTCIKGKGQG